jgi:membrane protein
MAAMSNNEITGSSAQKAGSAPAPDDERKPGSPGDVTKPSWKYVAKKTLREFNQDQCTDLAAALTYYGVLSLFPGLLALVSLLGIFGQAEKTTSALLEIVQGIAPGATVDIIRNTVEDLTSSGAAGFALVAGIATGLWSASGYVTAFGRAMNRVYEIDEGRPFLKLRGTMLAVTIATIALVALLAAMLVLSGPVAEAVGGAIGLSGAFLTAWNIIKWPIILVLVVLAIAMLFYATPNVKQPKFRWMSMGSAIALGVMVLASLGFGFYVANFGNYNKTYGAIGGVIIMLLWLWLMNLALLFGAEFDAETERGRQLQAGIEAEETLQLPPRDTKKSEKLQKQEEEDIRAGRELREQHNADDGGFDRKGGDGKGRDDGARNKNNGRA